MLAKTDLLRFLKSQNFLAAATYLVIATVLAGAGLTAHVFWADEAMTALIARNIVTLGQLTGWDGTNVYAYHGGLDLDESLRQFVGPFLQFYVTAASFWLFGESTIAGRLPFLVMGLASLVVMHCWVARQFNKPIAEPVDRDFPAWLPSLLLALNVSFLLFSRQCRYYSLVFLFFPALFWAFAALRDSRRPWLTIVLGVLAAIALYAAHYMAGVGAVAIMAILLLRPRYRTRMHFIFVAATGAVVGTWAVYTLATGDPTQLAGPPRGGIPVWQNAPTLMWWQLRALGSFEFLPLLVMPILALPFFLARLKKQRAVAEQGAWAFAGAMLFLLITAVASPQPTQGPQTDGIPIMRYVLPVLMLGSVATACAIVIVWRWLGRGAAAALAALVVLTNVTYLGATSIRSTLWELVYEQTHWQPSGSDAMATYAQALPADTQIKVEPHWMTAPVQFYAPHLRFVGVLNAFKKIEPGVRAQLPEYVFLGRTLPQIVMIGFDATRLSNTVLIQGRNYALKTVIKTYWIDLTRPELVSHEFRRDPANDQRHVIAVFELAAGPQ